MREKEYDAVVIGAGAAGLAAALRIQEAGFRVAIIEREDHLGGILLQCIHNGFGLHLFNEELTGPEFAERFSTRIGRSDIDVFLNTTVTAIEPARTKSDATRKRAPDQATAILVCGPECGVLRLVARGVVLAMGCRERNRGNLGIPGTRPAGIFTAGLAQRLVNIEGYIPGRRVVIIGSGDIGLIMARRLSWVGAKVLGVVEILPYPSGLTRNIVQCLHDFDIPLHLSHIVSQIEGKDRVEAVTVSPLENGTPNPAKSFRVECDTVLLSVGLIPENELSRDAGVVISHDTGGAVVDANLMTNQEGVFACGNVLHVHDLVDWACEEAMRCGAAVVEYLSGNLDYALQGRVIAGANVRYVVPHRYAIGRDNPLSLRSLVVKDRGTVMVKQNGIVLKRHPLRHIKPAEMIYFTLRADDVPAPSEGTEPRPIEISVE